MSQRPGRCFLSRAELSPCHFSSLRRATPGFKTPAGSQTKVSGTNTIATMELNFEASSCLFFWLRPHLESILLQRVTPQRTQGQPHRPGQEVTCPRFSSLRGPWASCTHSEEIKSDGPTGHTGS